MTDAAETKPTTTPPRCLVVVSLVVAGVVYVALRELGTTAYDDSYFFKRFAMHALAGDGFSWNVEDGPVYGSTSQAFQWLCTVVAWATHTHFVTTMRIVNAGLLAALGWLLVRACGRVAGSPSGAAVGALACLSPLVLSTIETGMETALALAVLTIVLLATAAQGKVARPQRAAWATVAVYLCRPDAALIPAVVFLAELLSRATDRRANALRYLVTLAAGMAVVWGAAWLYYGTPLPLSFYMKSLALHSYDEHTAAIGWAQKRSHVGAFVLLTAPLWAVALRGAPWRSLNLHSALLLSAVAFCGYHILATHEIMGYRARFYVPAVVPLALAAAHGLRHAPGARGPRVAGIVVWLGATAAAYGLAWIPTADEFFASAIPWPAYAAVCIAGSWMWLVERPPAVAVTIGLLLGVVGWKPPVAPTLRDDREMMVQHAREVTTFRGVFDVARCLSPGSTVYHSEMGVTGLALFRMRVVDLVGIVSRRSGVDGVPFEQLCAEDDPEAIFLPHRGYRALNEEIQASRCLQRYVRMVDRSSSPLHVRADLAGGFEACAVESKRWRDPT